MARASTGSPSSARKAETHTMKPRSSRELLQVLQAVGEAEVSHGGSPSEKAAARKAEQRSAVVGRPSARGAERPRGPAEGARAGPRHRRGAASGKRLGGERRPSWPKAPQRGTSGKRRGGSSPSASPSSRGRRRRHLRRAGCEGGCRWARGGRPAGVSPAEGSHGAGDVPGRHGGHGRP